MAFAAVDGTFWRAYQLCIASLTSLMCHQAVDARWHAGHGKLKEARGCAGHAPVALPHACLGGTLECRETEFDLMF